MDVLIGSGVAACLIYGSIKWKPSEEKKIQHVFENTGYRVKDKVPRIIKKDKKETYIDYIYNVPYGLVDDPKLQPILEKTLIKPVAVMFRGKLIVRVYNKNLTTHVDYDWQPSKRWTVPIGESLDGMIYHDFDKIPHMSMSGTTRYGKTVLLKLIFAHLINNNPNVEFYIIDLKRLEFSKYSRLRQVKQFARTQSEAKQCLKSIVNEMDETMNYFERKGLSNITETNINWRKFIIIDEGGQLDNSLHEYLEKIAMVGGGIGYRLIFATQYGTGDVFPRQVKQNSDAKIAFRLPTGMASRVAIDENGAEQIDNVGRAIYRTAEKHLVQVPLVEDGEIKERLKKYERTDSAEDKPARKDIIEFG